MANHLQRARDMRNRRENEEGSDRAQEMPNRIMSGVSRSADRDPEDCIIQRGTNPMPLSQSLTSISNQPQNSLEQIPSLCVAVVLWYLYSTCMSTVQFLVQEKKFLRYLYSTRMTIVFWAGKKYFWYILVLYRVYVHV